MISVLPVEGGAIQVRRALQAISQNFKNASSTGGLAKAGSLVLLDAGGRVGASILVPIQPTETVFFANSRPVKFDSTGEIREHVLIIGDTMTGTAFPRQGSGTVEAGSRQSGSSLTTDLRLTRAN